MKRAAAAVLTAALLALPVVAHAQAPFSGPQSFVPPPAHIPGKPEELSPSHQATLSRRSVKLFDGRRTKQYLELDLGPVWYRQSGTRNNFEHGTGEISLGVMTSAPWKPFVLSGVQQTNLRIFDSQSFAWSPLMHQIVAAVQLGPFEPQVRVGVSLLTVDVFRGDWSVEMLSPRVAVGMGVRLGKIRLDFLAHSEYLWRWFGPDYHIRGISLGVRMDVPRPPKRPTL